MATTGNVGRPQISTFNEGVTSILSPFSKFIEMEFPQATFRFYPLPADRDSLQKFCDKYLNFFDEPESERPPVYFRVPLPYVLLQLVDYPRMEERTQWLRSREVIFSIPLEWYTRDDKGLHFQKWGMTFPFIYLDSPISIAIGREIYGFPKTQVQVVEDPTQPARAGESHPLLSPSQPRRLLAYNLPEFKEDSPGEPQTFSQSFLEVYQDPPSYPWSVSRPADLFAIWPRATAGYLSTLSVLAEATSAMARAAVDTPALWAFPKAVASVFASAAEQFQKVAGSSLAQAAATVKTDFRMPPIADLTTFAKMVEQGMGVAGAWLPEMFAPFVEPRPVKTGETAASPFMQNLISLKQFPDAEDPTKVCYQAIVRSSSKFETANDAGLLFDPLSGDPSGGISIRLYDNEPIVEALGIQATRDPHTNYATAKPLFPFWWNLDVGYGTAENLCWRTKDTSWSPPKRPGAKAPASHHYLRLRTSTADLEVPKPFATPSKVTLHVLPLQSDGNELTSLCNQLLNGFDAKRQFQPAAPYVLMLVAQFPKVDSGRPHPRKWSDTEVTLAIPAYENENKEQPVLLPLVTFVASEWNAITSREIYGRFSLQSSIKICDERQVNDLSISKVSTPELWFYVSSPLMGDRDEKEIMDIYSMLGVTRSSIAEGTQKSSTSQPLQSWLDKANLTPGSSKGPEFLSVALKQFRDAQNPATKACYRSLVSLRRRFETVTKKEWIEGAYKVRLRVNIRKYDNVKLASKLGLNTTAILSGQPTARAIVNASPMPPSLLAVSKLSKLGDKKLEEVVGEDEIVAENPILVEGEVSDTWGGPVMESLGTDPTQASG